MNLLQALQTLSKSAPQESGDGGAGAQESASAKGNAQQPAQSGKKTEPQKSENALNEYPRPNVMANVLERHEAIANRLRNKK